MRFVALLAMLALPVIGHADERLQKKCLAMSKVVQQIASDRDRGVPYATRKRRNYENAVDMPDFEKWLQSMTSAIYFDLANLSPAELAVAQIQACIDGGE